MESRGSVLEPKQISVRKVLAAPVCKNKKGPAEAEPFLFLLVLYYLGVAGAEGVAAGVPETAGVAALPPGLGEPEGLGLPPQPTKQAIRKEPIKICLYTITPFRAWPNAKLKFPRLA